MATIARPAADLRLRRRRGDLDRVDAGKETLDELAAEWSKAHVEPNLARATQESYAALYDRAILPRLGMVPSAR